VIDGDTIKTCYQLIENQLYWWRVRAQNSAGWGDFSGVRQFSISSTAVQVNSEVPKEFCLGQNYPNPFNSSTHIDFNLKESSFVRLKIFSQNGEEVETLLSKYINAGKYQVEWNAKNLPSGIYLYHLEAGDFVKTRKMILQK